ncbi:MAG: PLP-dependent aminotransferase family protein [Pseudomonas sp.]|uniref:MocR-like pyridoxine biosynthesis transcription factor PdxR n=1 Tax=Pseudomonas sp. TaxID=306 RepID=UPI00339538C9
MDIALLVASCTARAPAGNTSQQQRLYQALREALLSGTLVTGTRLPASRVLAQELGIARNSVLYAYERLSDEGFTLSDRQGTRVAPLGLGLGQGETGPSPALASRAAREGPSAVPIAKCLAPGIPALAAFPLARWHAFMNRAWRRIVPADLDTLSLQGHGPLREVIAQYLRVARGVRCSPQRVFITDGTRTSLDICIRVLTQPADGVWFENPGYDGARAAFSAANLRLLPVPVDAQGMAPDAALPLAVPRLIYVTPSHQYPLGPVMSIERRMTLLQHARRHGAYLIEDDYDSEFRYRGAPIPALQGLVEDAPVIYVGTFSKTLFPGLRIGFMVVPADLAERTAQALTELGRHGRLAEQMALADFIHSGAYGRHLRRMKRLYDARRVALTDALERRLHGVLRLAGEPGGMHLIVLLQVPLVDTELAARALDEHLELSPLSSHYQTPWEGTAPLNGLVLGYANLPEDQADAAVAALARIIVLCLQQLHGIPRL